MGACDCIITKVTAFIHPKRTFYSLPVVKLILPVLQAGPGTIAEAMIRGLPIILNDFIAGQVITLFSSLNYSEAFQISCYIFFLNHQEAGNVPYVVKNGCGKFSKSPTEIASIVAQWFGPKSDELVAMSNNALKLAKSDAVFKIVNDLHELVTQRRLLRQYSCAT